MAASKHDAILPVGLFFGEARLLFSFPYAIFPEIDVEEKLIN
jgi:hypothetical protein